jgi:hypothetical protein
MATHLETIQEELWKALLALVTVVAHSSVIAAIILCMWAIELLIRGLWTGSQEPMFGGVPLHTIMVGAEICVALIYILIAGIRAARAFW